MSECKFSDVVANIFQKLQMTSPDTILLAILVPTVALITGGITIMVIFLVIKWKNIHKRRTSRKISVGSASGGQIHDHRHNSPHLHQTGT